MSSEKPQIKKPAEIKERQKTPRREIKSFVLRQGRLTTAQQNALENHWQEYGINFSGQQLDFDTLFGNDNEVFVEVGFGNGESLLQQAINQPQYNFIGIEVHGPGVGHLIHEAQSRDVHNIKVIRHDAVEVLEQQIPDNSIKQLQLFFLVLFYASLAVCFSRPPCASSHTAPYHRDHQDSERSFLLLFYPLALLYQLERV